jgi:hypothetical protein
MNFVYPVILMPDADRRFRLTFLGWPQAIIQVETRDRAPTDAVDCLEAVVAARIDDLAEIPSPAAPLTDEATVAVLIATALKAALHLTVREVGIATRRHGARGSVRRGTTPSRPAPREQGRRVGAGLACRGTALGR